jgi:hypothetical protein
MQPMAQPQQQSQQQQQQPQSLFQPLAQPMQPIPHPVPSMQPMQPVAQPIIPQPTRTTEAAMSRAAPIPMDKTIIEEKASSETTQTLGNLTQVIIPTLHQKLQGTSNDGLVEDASKRLHGIAALPLSQELASLLAEFTTALQNLLEKKEGADEALEHITNELSKHGKDLTMARVIGLKKLKLAAQKSSQL